MLLLNCGCCSPQGPPSGDGVIFVLLDSFKGSQLVDYYLLFNSPWGFCSVSDVCDDSVALFGEPVALWHLRNFVTS